MIRLIEFDNTLEQPRLVKCHKSADYRGELTRVFDEQLIGWKPKQVNLVYNRNNTLRGMHWQIWPKPVAKAVTCVCGSIQDVIVDLRPYSRTFMHKATVNLNYHYRYLLIVPIGFAHGFYAVSGSPTVVYGLSEEYDQQYERSFNYADTLLNNVWSSQNVIVSDKDKHAPFIEDLKPGDLEFRG